MPQNADPKIIAAWCRTCGALWAVHGHAMKVGAGCRCVRGDWQNLVEQVTSLPEAMDSLGRASWTLDDNPDALRIAARGAWDAYQAALKATPAPTPPDAGTGTPSDDEQVRVWTKRRGDRYAVVTGAVVGSAESGFTTEHYWDGVLYDQHATARRSGLRNSGSDDFNIAVIRRGALVAVLWMDEIVDDDPEVLADIATELGWGVPEPTPAAPSGTTGATTGDES